MKAPAAPATSSYDPSAAMQFFQSGKPLQFKPGTQIFAEREKGLPLLFMPNRMYLLIEGEVGILVNDKAVATVRQGEVFGEMAAINQAPRSAGAVAKTSCRVIALDDRQFHDALRSQPEFALMLMSVMVGRLRETLARLDGRPVPADTGWRQALAMDRDLLADLEKEIGSRARFRYDAGKTLMREGHLGVALFVVLEGQIAIRVGDTLVEKAGPGSVIGEMGLIDRTPRFATAVAETECTLLAVSRLDFIRLVRKDPRFGALVLGTMSERARSMAERCKP
ncbi:MAG: cyclic nucleotide-binding domain-containing protein [Burkholderiales bacterium]